MRNSRRYKKRSTSLTSSKPDGSAPPPDPDQRLEIRSRQSGRAANIVEVAAGVRKAILQKGPRGWWSGNSEDRLQHAFGDFPRSGTGGYHAAPVVDAMVQNDVDAVKGLVQKLAQGDPVGMAEVAFKWYELQYYQAPCA